MLRRVTVPLVAVLLVAAPGVPAAQAHPLEVFDACAAYTKYGNKYGPPCRDTQTYAAGSPVYLRAYLEPRHPGKVVRVWRREPDSGEGWQLVGSDRVNRNGIARWMWQTDLDDAKHDAAYRFRFSLPCHGSSDVIRVWVVVPE